MTLKMTCQVYLHIYGREFTTFLGRMYGLGSSESLLCKVDKAEIGGKRVFLRLFTLQASLVNTCDITATMLGSVDPVLVFREVTGWCRDDKKPKLISIECNENKEPVQRDDIAWKKESKPRCKSDQRGRDEVGVREQELGPECPVGGEERGGRAWALGGPTALSAEPSKGTSVRAAVSCPVPLHSF